MAKAVIKEDNHQEDISYLLAALPADLAKTGIIHIGAHQGEEVEEYLKQGFKNIILIEANPEWHELLRKKYSAYPNIKVFGYAIAESNTTMDFYIHASRSGNTESSSLLNMTGFKDIVKTMHTKKVIKVPVITLDSLFSKYDLNIDDYNFINMDIQGAELRALKGAGNTLSKIQVVISEVQLLELYENVALEEEMVAYLHKFGFIKEKGIYHELYDETGKFPAWGECLFIKKESGEDTAEIS